MAAKKTAGKKPKKEKPKRVSAAKARRSAARKKSASRKRLTPSQQKRGLAGSEVKLELDAPELASLRAEVEAVGGAALGAYREPLSGHAILLASLPIKAVEPTPFQRNLSPTHTKRLAVKIEECGSFLSLRGRGTWASVLNILEISSIKDSSLILIISFTRQPKPVERSWTECSDSWCEVMD